MSDAKTNHYAWRVAEVKDLFGRTAPWLARGQSEMRQLEKQPTFSRWLTPKYSDRFNPAELQPKGYFINWPAIGGGRQVIWSDSKSAALAIGCPWAPAYIDGQMRAGDHGTIHEVTEEDEDTSTDLLQDTRLPLFEDSDVQVVYEILESPEVPPESQHWEGWVSRKVVLALRDLHPIVEAKVEKYVESHQTTWWVVLYRGTERHEVRHYPFRQLNRAEYEVAELNYFLGNGPEPDIRNFPDQEPDSGNEADD